MHEMSLAEGMVELVEQAARREGAQRVKQVILEIGRLAAVDPEALRFCFEAVVRGGLAEGARLTVIEVAGSGWCEACACVVPMEEAFGVCFQCGRPVQPTAGTGMRLREIEIE